MKVRRFNRRAAADSFRIDVYSTGNFEDSFHPLVTHYCSGRGSSVHAVGTGCR